jgi:hypothetical protein
MHWFTAMIEEVHTRLGSNEEVTAEFLGVKRLTLHKWRKGTIPSLALAEQAIKSMGGDLEAASKDLPQPSNPNLSHALKTQSLEARIAQLERILKAIVVTSQNALERTPKVHMSPLAAEDTPHYGAEPTPVKLI